MEVERLGRILRGERWMTLPDLVALGHALDSNLIRFAYPGGVAIAGADDGLEWVPPPEVLLPGDSQL